MKRALLLKLMGSSEKEIKIIRAGYTGDTATLDKLKDSLHISSYCMGTAAAGNKELVLQCLDKGASPGWGLKGAAMGGQMEIVQLLLDKGAGPDFGLSGAAMGGHMDIVQLMLDKGALPAAGLYNAAEGGHMDIVRLLLDKGGDPNDGLWGAAYGGHMDIVQLMLSKGATDYYLGLWGAADGGHMDIVKLLLEKGADPNTGLCCAVRGGQMDMVELLLAQPGIDVNREDEDGYTPLYYAEENGHTECADLLRAAGAELQLTDYNEGLIEAAEGGYIDIVQLIRVGIIRNHATRV